MKRAICLILAVVLLASLLLAIVPAAYAAGLRKQKTQQVCTYVDADQDGICDNRGENCGQNYVDAAKDGICDNRAENTCGNAQRPASCPCQMMGRGCGRR